MGGRRLAADHRTCTRELGQRGKADFAEPLSLSCNSDNQTARKKYKKIGAAKVFCTDLRVLHVQHGLCFAEEFIAVALGAAVPQQLDRA